MISAVFCIAVNAGQSSPVSRTANLPTTSCTCSTLWKERLLQPLDTASRNAWSLSMSMSSVSKHDVNVRALCVNLCRQLPSVNGHDDASSCVRSIISNEVSSTSLTLSAIATDVMATRNLFFFFFFFPVKAPYNDALYADNRVTTTGFTKTVGLHCKFPPYNSNDARVQRPAKFAKCHCIVIG